MPWECLNCGYKNPESSDPCDKCQLDKERAVTLQIKLKTSCDECGHRHKYKQYCHVYVPLDNVFEREEGDSDRFPPLHTPPFVRDIDYCRCECKHGIDPSSRRFVQFIDEVEYIGELPRLLYHDVINQEKEKELTIVQPEPPLDANSIVELLPWIMSFLPFHEVSQSICASVTWSQWITNYYEYTHLRDFIPTTVHRVSQHPIDSILAINNNIILTGTNKTVLATDQSTGTTLSKIYQDAANIIFMTSFHHCLYCCSNNGSIRSFELAHHVESIKMVKNELFEFGTFDMMLR